MKSFKVLIVEDEVAMTRLYERMIKKCKGINPTILKARDNDEAFDLFLENTDIDAAVLDGSPKGSGFTDTYKLALAIRLRRPDCRLIAVTGNPAGCKQLWDFCDRKLAKPFEKEDFWEALGLVSSI